MEKRHFVFQISLQSFEAHYFVFVSGLDEGAIEAGSDVLQLVGILCFIKNYMFNFRSNFVFVCSCTVKKSKCER